jgi:NAD(P)-dependent dehydrogenase (short-subunit alcohol dehydrogenase family)
VDRVKDKVCIVTGGALGLGRSAAELLAREGARVALLDVRDDDGMRAVDDITAALQGVAGAGELGFWQLDVTDEQRITGVFAQLQETWGSIDVLVNNAGIAGPPQPTDQVAREDWERTLAVNVTGVFLCTKHAVPFMRDAGGGSIINLSSIYGIVGSGGSPPYHASKGAVRLMTKNDALAYAAEGIRVNSIHPGVIMTPMVENGVKQMGDAEQVLEGLRQLHPLGHLGEPDDVGWAVVYLASDESKFVTGAELVVDGGYTAR